MSVIILKKPKWLTALDTNKWLQLWVVPLPELQARVRVEIGQEKIYVPVRAEQATHQCAFFSAQSGGELLKVAESNPVHVLKGDTILYKVHWQDW